MAQKQGSLVSFPVKEKKQREMDRQTTNRQTCLSLPCPLSVSYYCNEVSEKTAQRRKGLFGTKISELLVRGGWLTGSELLVNGWLALLFLGWEHVEEAAYPPANGWWESRERKSNKKQGQVRAFKGIPLVTCFSQQEASFQSHCPLVVCSKFEFNYSARI